MNQEAIKISDLFLTSDLALTAALVCWGFTVISIDRTDPGRAVFSFKKSKEIEQAIKFFWDNSGKISPKDYFNVLRELKSRIREGNI